MSSKQILTGVLAAGLALTLVAAESAATEVRTGTASTSLLGVELEVTGVDAAAASVLDVTSYASTDPADEGNPLDAAFAMVGLVPLRAAGQQTGAVTVSSDDGGEATSPGATYGDALAPVRVTVAPVRAAAEASAERALATVDATLAELGALASRLGLQIDLSGVTSLVDANQALADQSLLVSSLSLQLADLGLDEDLLGLLSLGDVLALLDQLPLALPADLQAVVVDVVGGIAKVDDVLADLQAQGDAIGALTSASPAVDALIGDLSALLPLPTLDAVTALLTDGSSLLSGCDLAEPTLLDLVDVVDDAIACLTGTLDGLVAELSVVVGELSGLLDQLVSVLTDLTGAFGDLDELITTLLDLLPEIAATELLGIGAFDLGVTAVAADTLEESSAWLLCEPASISVLGETFATPSCAEGRGGLATLTGAVDDALGQVADLLNALPLAEAVTVGDLRADLFTNVVEEVTQDGGTITATAGFTLLDLAVPSITVDPTAVGGDLLGGLELPDVLAQVEAVLGQVQSELGALTAVPGVSDVLATVDGLVTDVDATGGIAALMATVEGLLATLDLGSFGTLAEAVTLPGLRLAVPGPTSEASYTVAVVPGEPQPAPAPAPEPETPELPSTGGGAALLGLLALAGAAAMRRRR